MAVATVSFELRRCITVVIVENFLNQPSRYNNETYRIDDIDWDRNPTYTFERKGEQVSLIQYYEEKYNRCVLLSSPDVLT